MKQIGNCTLAEKNGRFVMTNEATGDEHSISSRADITSPARLQAHWEGFLSNHLEAMKLEDLSAETLKEGIANAKRSALTQVGGDFCDGSGQLVLHDARGERVGGGPLDYFTGVPSVRVIREAFEDHPDAVSMAVEGETRWFGEGNAVERKRDAEPCDWWVLNITR